MGLLAFLRKMAVRTGEQVGGLHVSPFNHRRPYSPDVSYNALVKRYQSYVYAVIKINAVTISETPLRLFSAKPNMKSKALFSTCKLPDARKKWIGSNPDINVRRKIADAAEVEEVLEHPFLDLITQVNNFMNGFDLTEGLSSFLDLTGNAYWFIAKNPLGVPVEIWPLFPQYMKVIPDKEAFISGYEYKPSLDTKTIFKPDEIVHFKTFHPYNTYYGMGALQAAILASDLGISMNKYEIETFESAGLQDMALTLPVEAGEPPAEEIGRMQKDWKKKYGGIKNKGVIPIATGGAKLESISFSPKEMSFMQGRKASLSEVAAIFGVPMSLLTTEDVNRANADAGERQHAKKTVLPRLRKIEQKINEQLMPMFDQRLFVAFDNPVAEDKEFQLKERESNLKTGYSTINAERELNGLDPVDYGEVPLLPMNIVPLGSVADQPVADTNSGKTITKNSKVPQKLPPLGVANDFVNDEMVLSIQKFFKRQEKALLGFVDRDAEALNNATSTKSVIGDDFTSGWFDMQVWNKELEEATQPFVRMTLQAGGEQALKDLSVETMYDPLNPEVARSLELHRTGSIVGINVTTQQKLRNLTATAIDEGEGVVGVRNRIMAEWDLFDKYRATTIARTEVIWAWNEGARQGYKQSGIVTRMEWLSTGDDRTCDFCPELDGKTVDITVDEQFFDKGEIMENAKGGKLNFEYEDVGHPPLHPMCRCTVIPVTEGF